MAFPYDYQQRQEVARVVEVLRRLQEDPTQLHDERTRRYSDPPPPYPSSGETTQPDSPAGHLDESALSAQRNRAMFQSMPREQFHAQRCREKDRIIHQLSAERYGRRRTLHFDGTLDFLANAENNVRARWMQQGIWKQEWGQAWPEGAKASNNQWRSSHVNIQGPNPSGSWGHEKAFQPPVAEEPEPEGKHISNIFAGLERKKQRVAPRKDVTKDPTRSDCDPTASRPYYQFLFQISQERKWLYDELQYTEPTANHDIDTLAYESTKKRWIEVEIWNPTWGDQPGMTWMHEDLLSASVGESHPPLLTPDAIDPTPTAGIHTNGTTGNSHSPFCKAIGRGRGKRIGSTTGSSIENQRQAKQSATRVLRSAPSSNIRKPTKPTSVSTRVQPVGRAPRRSARIAERTAVRTREGRAKAKGKITASSTGNYKGRANT